MCYVSPRYILSITQVISLAVFALGAWLLYVREENDYDVITGSGSIVSGAALLLLGGGVAIVVSALGMVGAYGLWRPVLVTVRPFHKI